MQNFLAADGTAGLQMWLKPGKVDGFSFVRVNSAEAIMAEAAAMKNCMRGYGDEVLDNTCRFWSVRSQGERRAVLSVVRYHDAPVPMIGELCGPKNKAVDLAVWIAAAKWLHSHDLVAIAADRPAKSPRLAKRDVWLQAWKPYWLDRGRIPRLLPLSYRTNWKWRLQRDLFDEDRWC